MPPVGDDDVESVTPDDARSLTPDDVPRRAMSGDQALEADDVPGATTVRAPERLDPESLPMTDRRHPFTRSLLLTAFGTIVPGLGLWRTRHRTLGIVITSLFALGLLALGAKAYFDIGGTAALAARPTQLKIATWALLALAVAWVAIIVGTHLATRPRRLTGAQRVTGTILVGLLSFGVSAPLAVAARYARSQESLISSIFKDSDKSRSQTRPTLTSGQDPWAGKERLNILLLGGDNSTQRDAIAPGEGIRTDTMMMASVDLNNGNTAIIQLPRNMEAFPFPDGSDLAAAYPNGYWDGIDNENAEYELNSVWNNVPAAHPDLFSDTDYPGADALKIAVEGITGLKPDYFVLLSIDGLQSFIDALGGVTLNVNSYLPVAQSKEQYEAGIPPKGGYLHPGQDRKLNGYYAMWFARSRSQSTDTDRMARQSCVVQAIVGQANPSTLVTHYEAIANAGKDALLSDIPQEVAPALVELALKMKDAKKQRVLFGYPTTTLPNGEKFKPWSPDVAQMKIMIQQGIDLSEGIKASASATPRASASAKATSAAPTTTSATPSASPSASASKAQDKVDLADACAWDPTAAAEAEANPPADLQVAGSH